VLITCTCKLRSQLLYTFKLELIPALEEYSILCIVFYKSSNDDGEFKLAEEKEIKVRTIKPTVIDARARGSCAPKTYLLLLLHHFLMWFF